MDANGTRFHLLLGLSDWGRCVVEDAAGSTVDALPPDAPVSWDPHRHELTLAPQPVEVTAGAAQHPLAPARRRGAGRDRSGSWYWIADEDDAIRVLSSGTGATSHFWRAGDGEAASPGPDGDGFAPVGPRAAPPEVSLRGLAVTEDHYLVVGTVTPAGLLVFDLAAGGPPRRLHWPDDVAFEPFDIAALGGGGVIVLDRTNRRYWELDRRFGVVPRGSPSGPGPAPAEGPFEPAGAPADAAGSVAGAGRLRPEHAVGLPDDPVTVEVAGDGSVLVLERAGDQAASLLRRYDRGRAAGSATLADAATGVAVAGHDAALLRSVPSAGDLGLLLVAADTGNQAFAFTLHTTGDDLTTHLLRDAHYPMRLFGGRALVAAGGEAYYDFADRWVPLVRQYRPRHETTATIATPLLDGHEPGCHWHRLMIDGCLPPGTRLRVWSAASDEPRHLERPVWRPEPDPYRRGTGAELPAPARPPGYATFELLFQGAVGRYLRLRLELTGDGRTTPRLRALRAYYPRFSYLERYLPAAYREDEASASFLDRYLANLEGVWTEVEDGIAAAHTLLDPRSAPADALDWLAGWMGLALDPGWDERRRRLLLSHAAEFFRLRGTPRGLQLALLLATDPDVDESVFARPGQTPGSPRIVERFSTRGVPAVVYGDPTSAGPRIGTVAGRWQPADGAAALHERYRATTGIDEFPLTPPADPSASATWRRFALATLGFAPSAATPDVPRWRAFLERRHLQVMTLNAAYALPATARLSTFADATLPAEVPQNPAALRDWHEFESLVLGAVNRAHRFTVLLPAPVGARERGAGADARRRALLDLVTRIVELEKPVHTVFAVRFFWSAFRLDEARLGRETMLDVGARAAGLLAPATAGHSHLGETVLHGPACATADRLPLR